MLLMAILMGAVMVGDRLVLGMGAWSWVMLLAYLASLGVLSKAQDLRSWIPAPRQRPPERAAADTQAEPPTHLYARTVAVGVVILLAGFVLAQSADATAEQTGLGESFFGAVFLGLSTSLPELSTVLAAVKLRRYEMAMADVFGTNLFNVTIVVLVDALHSGGPVLSEVSRSAGFGAMLGLLLTGMMTVGVIERRDRTVLRMGYDSFAVMVTYAIGVVVLYRLG
jgi:cation:H+ antiporter